MEASEAGTQTAETGTETAGGEQAQEGPDFSPVLDRFEELDRSFNDRFEQIEQRLPEQQQQQGEEGEPDLFLDEQGRVVDQYGQPVDTQQLAQQEQGQDPRALQALMQQQMQQQMTPVLQELAALREDALDRQAAELETRYPQFQDEKYAEKIVTDAEQRAERYGNPELARNADFIELLHLAEVGRQRAADQQTADGASEQGVALETGGVSPPASGQDDLGAHIDQAIEQRAKRSEFFS